MGVPAFYRWISEKYSKIVVDMLEQRPTVIEGVIVPLNLQQPNPNDREYDNLYVDMNGLIHPCSHPEDREPPKTEEEMYINVTKYLDRLVAAVRPRRLLYLAIDGVAPRAKMNQQRSRRFRAAQDAKEKKEVMDTVISEMLEMGFDAPDSHADGAWDSNVITPGTEFMCRLSIYIRFYILERMNHDPFWKGIKVVLSDASEPGEGEHKIMGYIRTQRAQPGYDPNQRHILHGLDADLIMLALATHEAHFTILREKVTFGRKRDNEPQVSDAQRLLDAQSMRNGVLVSCLNPEDEWVYTKPLQALHINTLREYLDNEFSCLKLPGVVPFGYDLERVIDDFIFLCFFVGNDFLPHLPSLDIRDGALDFLIEVYKELLPSLGGYITSPGGIINLSQADVILGRVGEVEDQIFVQRKSAEDREESRRRSRQGHNGPNSYGQNNRYGGNSNSTVVGAGSTDSGSGVQHMQPPPSHGHAPPHPTVPAPPSLPPAQPQDPGATTATTSAAISQSEPSSAPSKFETKANVSAAQSIKETLLRKRKSTDDAAAASSTTVTDTTTAAADVMDEGRESEAQSPQAKKMATHEQQDGNEDCTMDNTTVGGDTVGDEDAKGTAGAKGDDAAAAAADDDDDDDNLTSVTEDFESGDEEISTLVSSIIVAQEKKKVLSKEDLAKAKEELKARMKAKEQEVIDKNKQTIKDGVRLHEQGWKERYYGEKHKKENIESGGGLARMCFTYVQGLCWVLRYYYEGVPSWNWYYPFHYAPFASDLRNIDQYGKIEFELSEPFRPIEQLLAVFPANSVHALPKPCHWLMTDPSSPIIDLYSDDVALDPNGKHLPWLWILLLPFVDETRITAAFNLCKEKLSLEEARRNAFGEQVVFVHKNSRLGQIALSSNNESSNESNDSGGSGGSCGKAGKMRYVPGKEKDLEVISALDRETARMNAAAGDDGDDSDVAVMSVNAANVGSSRGGDDAAQESVTFDCVVGNGMAGTLSPPPPSFFAPLHSVIASPPYCEGSFQRITSNEVLCLTYSMPPNLPHLSQLLPGVVPLPSALNQYDLMPRRPPRLNRGGFNIIDLLTRNNNSSNARSHPVGGSNGYGRGGFGGPRHGGGGGEFYPPGGAGYFQQQQQHQRQQSYSAGGYGSGGYRGGSNQQPYNSAGWQHQSQPQLYGNGGRGGRGYAAAGGGYNSGGGYGSAYAQPQQWSGHSVAGGGGGGGYGGRYNSGAVGGYAGGGYGGGGSYGQPNVSYRPAGPRAYSHGPTQSSLLPSNYPPPAAQFQHSQRQHHHHQQQLPQQYQQHQPHQQHQQAPFAAPVTIAAPPAHNVSSLRDKDFQRISQLGRQHLGRDSRIGAYNKGPALTGTGLGAGPRPGVGAGGIDHRNGRQAVFIDQLPTPQQQDQLASMTMGGSSARRGGGRGGNARASSVRGVGTAGRGGREMGPATAATRPIGHSFLGSASAGQASLGGAGVTGSIGAGRGGPASMQSLRNQLFDTLQQQDAQNTYNR